MEVSSLYDVSAYLAVLLVLAGFLVRDRRRSRYLLVGAGGLFVGEIIIWLAQTQWEEIMPIKLILEAVGATVALVCFALAVKAFIELSLMNRAAKRRPQLLQTEPHKETERPIRRAS
jgi:hypothetical protein